MLQADTGREVRFLTNVYNNSARDEYCAIKSVCMPGDSCWDCSDYWAGNCGWAVSWFWGLVGFF